MTKARHPRKPDLAGKQRRGVAILGTDTGVGKTVVAASLARAWSREGLRVGVFKPFASDPALDAKGNPISTDAALLACGAGLKGGWRAACGQLFRAPLAPLSSALMEGRKIDLRSALAQARQLVRGNDLTIIEGCGGWHVPLTPSKTTADFFAQLGLPVLIVARTDLGTVNHTLLTVESIQARGLEVLGVILNRTHGGRLNPAERTAPDLLGRFCPVPVWGPVPFAARACRARLDRVTAEALPDLRPLARLIFPSS